MAKKKVLQSLLLALIAVTSAFGLVYISMLIGLVDKAYGIQFGQLLLTIALVIVTAWYAIKTSDIAGPTAPRS